MTDLKLLDGAMGSEFIRRGEILPPHTWSADVNLTNPDLLYGIHQEYVNAGVDYLTTNTFRTTPRAYQKTGYHIKKHIALLRFQCIMQFRWLEKQVMIA